ncbi:MAG: hypothetical protein JO214_08295 [Frankiaceae bacterium]|nr:hypothetical protein [Frankiaceae bacterium]
MSFVHGDPARVDDLIMYVRTVVKPAIDKLAGSQGLGMWVNRQTGECLVTSVWDTEAMMLASERDVERLRDAAAGIIGSTAIVERGEAVLLDEMGPNWVGNIMRLSMMRCEPAELDTHLEWAREHMLPTLRTLTGYRGHVIAIDRAAGLMMAHTTFTDRRCAAVALEATASLRESASARGLMLDNMVDYEIAIVGIRTPTAHLPAQRTVDLTEPATTRR